MATDTHIGLWNIMMAQKGYVVIDMDNRGTPCLKGSQWRKSIYRQVGRINARDQGLAAKELYDHLAEHYQSWFFTPTALTLSDEALKQRLKEIEALNDKMG